jgi:exodeoxyribonuclease VII large subunit
MEVVASGKLTTYPGSSKYQIVIDNLEPAGSGALMALLEERKRRLAAEGLFDAGRKRTLPYLPRIIGVITSPTGAVIRDILHRIADRFPLHVIVWPARVQGETSAAEVTAAIRGFNALAVNDAIPRPDLLIVARGGGSLEDLWGFSDEALVRAVAASEIPIISAIGHETDWTLVDLAADVRAPTPTGAAEIAVPVKAELEAILANLSARLGGSLGRLIDRRRNAFRAAARVLPSPDQLFGMPRRRLDETSSRLERALELKLDRHRNRLGSLRLTAASLDLRLAESRRRLLAATARSDSSLRMYVRDRRARMEAAAGRLTVEPLARRTALMRERLNALIRRKDQTMALRLERLASRLEQAERLLNTLSHKAILARGFALVFDPDGAVVRRASDLDKGETVSLQFADATVQAVTAGGHVSAARPKPKAPSGGQGSLF